MIWRVIVCTVLRDDWIALYIDDFWLLSYNVNIWLPRLCFSWVLSRASLKTYSFDESSKSNSLLISFLIEYSDKQQWYILHVPLSLFNNEPGIYLEYIEEREIWEWKREHTNYWHENADLSYIQIYNILLFFSDIT